MHSASRMLKARPAEGLRARAHMKKQLAGHKRMEYRELVTAKMRNIYLQLELVLFLAAFLLVPYALSDTDQVLGETFPSCVEILSIHPPPYSVLKRSRDKAVWFEITFSKPVFKRKIAEDSKEPIFLSPNAARLEGKGNTKRLYPDLVQRNTTNYRKWAVKFTLANRFFNYFGSVFR